MSSRRYTYCSRPHLVRPTVTGRARPARTSSACAIAEVMPEAWRGLGSVDEPGKRNALVAVAGAGAAEVRAAGVGRPCRVLPAREADTTLGCGKRVVPGPAATADDLLELGKREPVRAVVAIGSGAATDLPGRSVVEMGTRTSLVGGADDRGMAETAREVCEVGAEGRKRAVGTAGSGRTAVAVAAAATGLTLDAVRRVMDGLRAAGFSCVVETEAGSRRPVVVRTEPVTVLPRTRGAEAAERVSVA